MVKHLLYDAYTTVGKHPGMEKQANKIVSMETAKNKLPGQKELYPTVEHGEDATTINTLWLLSGKRFSTSMAGLSRQLTNTFEARPCLF